MPCYFNKKCKDSGIPSADIQFKIKLYDDAGNKRDITLPKEDLLVEGAALGKGDICFLGVYKYPSSYTK